MATRRIEGGIKAPSRHVGRTAVACLALSLALGGTSFAAGKLLTGADIEDDSLTGADIVETSLAKVPAATSADQLGGLAAGWYLKAGSAAGGSIAGTYPNPEIAADAVTTNEIRNQTVGRADLADGAVSAPKLLGGAAATNVWGKDQWAPANATQRGYTHVFLDGVSAIQIISVPGIVSFPVPLAPGDTVQNHVIEAGDTPPTGCGGTIEQPTAAPGHFCAFYDAAYAGDKVSVHAPAGNYGRILHLVDGSDNPYWYGGNASVVWAMTPPIG